MFCSLLRCSLKITKKEHWNFCSFFSILLFVCFEVNSPRKHFSAMSRQNHRLQDINQYYRELMCLSQGHNTRLGLRFSTTSSSRPPLSITYGHDDTLFSLRYADIQGVDQEYANQGPVSSKKFLGQIFKVSQDIF